MMHWPLIAYCVLIMGASLAGGVIPLFLRLSHRTTELLVSFVAGAMLVVGMLHLLPHAVEEAPGGVGVVFAWALGGFLCMFFLERFFCYHHHDIGEENVEGGCDAVAAASPHRHEHVHGNNIQAGHARSSHQLTWSGAAIGLSLHSILAGVALGASVQLGSSDTTIYWAGLSTFLVIFLHKPFDSLTLAMLMSLGTWSKPARHLVNAIFALMVPIGVVLFAAGMHGIGDQAFLSAALAFSAGTFICIAASDLLPELHFHDHDRVPLSLALAAGVAIAVGIGLLEHSGGTCAHGHDHAHGQHVEDGDSASDVNCDHDHGPPVTEAGGKAPPNDPVEPNVHGHDHADHVHDEHAPLPEHENQ